VRAKQKVQACSKHSSFCQSEREREKERGRETVRKRERDSEREGEKEGERCRIWLLYFKRNDGCLGTF